MLLYVCVPKGREWNVNSCHNHAYICKQSGAIVTVKNTIADKVAALRMIIIIIINVLLVHKDCSARYA